VSKNDIRTKYYTGVGSQQTPKPILAIMSAIGEVLFDTGYILRSGGADGADTFFEEGADALANISIKEGVTVFENGHHLGNVWSHKEIYLPKRGFNHHTSALYNTLPAAFEIAERIHPAWERCNDFARKAHARNAHQVLGQGLNDPSDFVICWTKDGKPVGGTATAIRLAQEHGLRVVNLANENWEHEPLTGFDETASDLLAKIGTTVEELTEAVEKRYEPRNYKGI